MIKRFKLALVAASVALLAPAAASACNLDGVDGMHRMNPFGAMALGRSAPVPTPPLDTSESKDAQPAADHGGRNTKNKAEKQPLPARKWEQESDGAPVPPEDFSTFI